MSASAAQIDELREYIADPEEDDYSDPDLQSVIERYALTDSSGHEPASSAWTPTYDLNAAAANIWRRKAASLAAMYDFSADGGSFKRSQLYQQAKDMARYYSGLRAPSSISLQVPQNFERDYQSDYWESENGIVANAMPDDEDE